MLRQLIVVVAEAVVVAADAVAIVAVVAVAVVVVAEAVVVVVVVGPHVHLSEPAQAEEMIGPKNWIWVQQQIQLIQKGQTMIVTELIDLLILRSTSEVFEMTP